MEAINDGWGNLESLNGAWNLDFKNQNYYSFIKLYQQLLTMNRQWLQRFSLAEIFSKLKYNYTKGRPYTLRVPTKRGW